MPKWRKATWAIAVWTGFTALIIFVMTVTMIVKPPDQRVGADLVLWMAPAEWLFGMMILYPIWFFSRPKSPKS